MVLTCEEQIKVEELKHKLKLERLAKVLEIAIAQKHDLCIEHI